MPTIYKNGKNYGGGTTVDSALSSTSTNPVQNKVVKQALDELILNFANYYNKTEVDSIVNAIKNSRFEVVATLPTTDIKTNVIYLVPKSPAQTNNVKEEYINLDGTSSGWEKIGDTEIDLSGYVTINALNTALSNYTTTTDLTALLNNKVDKVTGKGLSTNDFTDAYKSQVDSNATNILTLYDNKVNKVQGKGLSTNDFTDNYKKGISISQELAYDKSKEYIPSSDADFHNVSDGEIFTKDGVTYSIHSIIQNPKTKEYIYTLSYGGHPTHGYAFAIVKDPTSDRDDWNILKPSGIVAHQIPCVSERFDGYVRFYSVYVDTSGEEQVSTLIYSDDLYEWTKMDVESVTIRLYQMGNNAFCYTDKLYEIDDLQILPTDLPYQPLKTAYGGGRLVVLTSNRGIYMSYDGIQWELKGTSIYSGDIIYGNGIFLIYSYEEDTVYVSKDGGYIWETQSVTVYNGDNVNPNEREVYEYYFPFREIGYARGIFFGTSGYHKQGQSLSEDLYGIWTSKDGYNWEITATDIEEEYKVTDNLYNETYIINTKNNLYYPTLSVGDALDAKVDKVTGKGLSTNDYTDAEKQKNADNASAIEELQEDIAQSQTATGNPLTIEASESNLVECVAEVEAVQDLHGYDYPWVGGAGKNKLSSTAGTVTKAGVTYTMSDNQKLTVSGVATGNSDYVINLSNPISLTAGQTIYFQMMNFTGTLSPTNVGIWLNEYETMLGYFTATNKVLSYTATSDITISILIYRHYLNNTNNNYTANLSLSINEELTTFEPYSNICPITGQTEVVIEDVGKNLFDVTNAYNGYIDANGEFIAYNGVKASSYFRVEPNKNYTLSYYRDNTGMATGMRIAWYDKDKNFIRRDGEIEVVDVGNKSITATCPNNGRFARISLPYTNEINKLQLELGNIATTYEPYKGKTYTIQLGDTIYGGELDVLTGKLRVTHGEVDLGDLEWERTAAAGYYYKSKSTLSNSKNPSTPQTKPNAICSCFDITSYTEGYYPSIDKLNVATIIFEGSDYAGHVWCNYKGTDSTLSDFVTAVAGQQLVYELAEPHIIQLTPQQIRLLKGTNNISCNTGDLSIKYYPDNVLGQLKGDIEGEYDERVETLETQVQELQPPLIFMSRERRDITSDLGRLSTAVAEQNLAKYGYKIGDYFTGASGYTYILADYNTFKGTSTPYCITSNHLGIVVDTHQTSQWHSGDASNVGYNGSVLNTFLKGTVLDNIKADFKALFGGSTGLEHLLAHSKLYTTALANWGWQANQYISALTCTQIDAGSQWTANGFQEGEASKSLELFRKHKWTEIFESRYLWLRNLSNYSGGSDACYATNNGLLTGRGSVANANYVVGIIIFH